MGDPIANPDVHWITVEGRHIPIPNVPETPEQRQARISAMKSQAGKQAPRVSQDTVAKAMWAQRVVARLTGGEVIPDNEAYDVIVGPHVIEVKSIQAAKNDKLTVHDTSLERKQMFTQRGVRYHWILAIDMRAPGGVWHPGSKRFTGPTAMYLWPPGKVGSFRFGNLIPTPEPVIRDIFTRWK